jgi:hypothetical protein
MIGHHFAISAFCKARRTTVIGHIIERDAASGEIVGAGRAGYGHGLAPDRIRERKASAGVFIVALALRG